MTRRSASLPPALAAFAILLAACTATAEPSDAQLTEGATPSSAATSPSESAAATDGETAEERVRISRSQFDPAQLTVAAGTEVVFVNADAFAHTVSHGTNGEAVDDPIVDEEIEQNGSVRVLFDEPGTYDITCGIHPSMQMTITVEG